MFQWFAQLPPGEQIALVIQVAAWIFSAGVYWATIRFLSKGQKKHDQRLDRHDQELKTHGEKIAELEVFKEMKTRSGR